MDWSSIGSLIVTLLTVVVVVGVLALVVKSSLYVVREYERLVVFRLGHATGARGPGLVVLIPGVERPVKVDLREQFLAISHQQCITKDNAPIAIDFLIYWRVLDPTISVIEVSNFAGASQGLATTTLRAVIGDLPLDDVLANRDRINRMLRENLDRVTERWGVKVTTVEIRDVLPPQNLDALKTVGSSDATKIVLPLEIVDALRPVMDMIAQNVATNGSAAHRVSQPAGR